MLTWVHVAFNTNATVTNAADISLAAVSDGAGSYTLTLATGSGVAGADVTATSVDVDTLPCCRTSAGW